MDQPPKIQPTLVTCPKCSGKGCDFCQNMGVWLEFKGAKYWFDKTSLKVSAPKLGRILLWIVAFCLAFLGLVLGIGFALTSEPKILSLVIYQGGVPLFFWFSMFLILFLAYYWTKAYKAKVEVSPSNSQFRILFNPKSTPPTQPVNITSLLTPKASDILREILGQIKSQNISFHPLLLLKTLIKSIPIQKILKRLEVDLVSLESQISAGLTKALLKTSVSLEEAALRAFLETLALGDQEIGPEHLLLALINTPGTQKLFYDLEIEIEDARNVALWVETEVRPRFRLFAQGPMKIKRHVMNRAWTARPTPTLDQFSYDLTDLAWAQVLGPIVDREQELSGVIRILGRTAKNNVLLIGEVGAGRTTIVKELACRIIKGDILPKLQDKRLVALDGGAVVAGVEQEGELEERIIKILNEIERAGNIILFIPDIHNLAEAGQAEAFDASEILAPVFSRSGFQAIGTTTYLDYRKSIEERSDFRNTFDQVKIKELTVDQSIQVLVRKAGQIEQEQKVILTYGAIKKAVELSKRYITDRVLPGKASDLLAEAAVVVKAKGEGIVKDEDIEEIITQKTGIPLTEATGVEAEKLLNLEIGMHNRIIDQEEAVRHVCEAIRRLRVGVKRPERPIGVFLFMGPTGVGKTETAKALAEIYFGSEKSMVRLDMSEFQTKEATYNLIGSPDGRKPGRLTEAIKIKPFSLILLDEFEKAHSDILNLFLQVFDDGRLTDSLGRTVDFTNTIIIGTSNAESKFILENINQGKTIDNIRSEMSKRLTKYFAPELLNRFDARVFFRPLSHKDIKAIAHLQLKKLASRLEESRGVKLQVEEEALEKLAKLGYSPSYGARPLQRVIREKVANFVTDKILKGEVKRGEVIEFGVEDVTGNNQ